MGAVKYNKMGFTLLELLVAMTMMSIIASSLYASLSIGFKAKESSESSIEEKRSARIVIDLLKREIVSALPPKGVLAGKFEGTDNRDSKGNDSDSLIFYSSVYNPEDDEVACDIIRVELAVSIPEDSDEKVLMRGVTTNLLSPKSLDPYENILCRGIKSLNLRYYDGYDWLDEWDSSGHDNSLPEAVEITIRLMGKPSGGNEKDNESSFICSFTLPCA